jgi:uncharacterized protein with ATP-grasp and redox domains
MRKECYYCHSKTRDQLIAKFQLSDSVAEDFSFLVDNFLQHNWHLSNPLIATHLHRIAKEQIEVDDLYESEKKNANDLILKNYQHWKQIVKNSENPFYTAAKLAVIGNIIDYGAHAVPDQIESFIEEQRTKKLAIDDTSELFDAIQKAKSILYIGDNAGEIVFDKLFIETIGHPNVKFAVRNEPIINDVTIKEAHTVGINNFCHIITNGNDAPSTLLELCSQEFINAFENADVIISKGQGNFEGLFDVKKKNL